MAKETIPFSAFLETIPSEFTDFVNRIHEFMENNGCGYTIKEAKSGYVVSYICAADKKTVANYVFRKKGPLIRLYADNVNQYIDTVNELPQSMKDTIIKAPDCKRLLNPNACNPRCQTGFDFILDSQRLQKCRNGGFMFFLSEENNPYLEKLVQSEVTARNKK